MKKFLYFALFAGVASSGISSFGSNLSAPSNENSKGLASSTDQRAARSMLQGPPSLRPWDPSQAIKSFEKPEPWHRANHSTNDFINCFRNDYHLIGRPAIFLRRLFGAPSAENGLEQVFKNLGPKKNIGLTVQLSEKPERVTSFRLEENSTAEMPIFYAEGPKEKIALSTGQSSADQAQTGIPEFDLTNTSCRFDSRAWLSSVSLRRSMLWDLVHSHELIGMPSSEAHALLGPGRLRDNGDPAGERIESYALFQGDYGGAIIPYFEVAYVRDCIRGFRICERRDVRGS